MPSDSDIDHLLERVAELDERLRAVEGRLGAAQAQPDAEADEFSAHVRELVASGHLIQAIDVHRKEAGLGLKEAKRRVEALAGRR